MATSQEIQDKRNELTELLSRNEKLTKADIQAFRSGGIAVSHMTAKHDAVSMRMEIELIDAIRSLDETSSFLSKVGIGVTFVGAAFTLLQVLIAFKVLPVK
jgi:hypothetical protein